MLPVLQNPRQYYDQTSFFIFFGVGKDRGKRLESGVQSPGVRSRFRVKAAYNRQASGFDSRLTTIDSRLIRSFHYAKGGS